jgi:MoaA/NifB/PqqE/SkfB family radical SAM enzyme
MIHFNRSTCRFSADGGNSGIAGLAGEVEAPISVIFQVTRRCNFRCEFCSEPDQIADTPLDALRVARDNLRGVRRVYVSGGETMMRDDLAEVLRLFKSDGLVVGLSTNATLHGRISPEIAGLVDYVNVGLDGPRSVTNRIRGDYDKILEGIYRFKALGAALSLTCVVLASTADSVLLTCQEADTLGAHKVKLVMPIPRGRGAYLPADEYLSEEQAHALFAGVKAAKQKYGWRTTFTMTTWKPDGFCFLVFPDGRAHAWPVHAQPDKVLYIGNILEEPVQELWRRYPYREVHLRKYLGRENVS